MTPVYIKWFRELRERFYPWPKYRRLERKNTLISEGQKSIVGKAPTPRQDVFDNE